MKKECLSRIENLETLRENLVADYELYTDEQLMFKPSAGHWNLLQVLDHIVTSEKMSAIYMKRQLSAKKYPPTPGFKSSVRYKMLKLALWLPFRYKAPAIVDSTDKSPRLNDLKESWKTIRNEIHTLTENTDEELLALGIYNHPRAGILNMEQALDFLDLHIRHHQKQMQRITEHEEFPAADSN